MFERFRRHVRGNVVGYLALFVALSGTTYAAVGLPPGSVGTEQLRNEAVTGKKVAPHTLTERNMKLSTLGAVPNAAHLGGRAPSAFQSRVSGSCSGNRAISAIAAGGSVSCQPTGTGTVTSVSSGTGLAGGPITGSGTLSLASGYRLPQSCSSGQFPKSDGSGGWSCGSANVTQMMGGSIGTLGGTTSQYLAPVGLSTPVASDAAARVGVSAVPTTAANLSASVDTAPGSGKGWEFIFYVNGSFTGGCEFFDPDTSCTDQNTHPIPAGATLSLLAGPVNGPVNSARVTFGWTATS